MESDPYLVDLSKVVNARTDASSAIASIWCMMFDSDIRQALKPVILAQMPESVLFDEMSLHRTARADVAAVNDLLWGFEIKGPRDSLNRLPLQVPYYERVFDRSVLVVSSCHLKKARQVIPRSWGIWVVEGEPGDISFDEVRMGRVNRNTDVESVIRLLWKNEAIRVARKLGKPVRRQTLAWYIWEHLASLPAVSLKAAIREELQNRARSEAVAPSS